MEGKTDRKGKRERNKNVFGFFPDEQKHKHLNSQFPNMMRGMKAGRRVRPKGVSAEVVGMAGNKENGKAGKGSGEPFPNVEGTPELSEEEIMKKLTIAQQRERLMQQLQQIEEEEKQLTKKIENARDAIFTMIKKKYNMNENDLREAFSQLLQGEDPVILRIIKMCEKRGADALKEKEFKQNAELIRKMHIVKSMSEKDVEKIAIYIEEAREYMERKRMIKAKNEIHHKGRLHNESVTILKHLHENGGRIREKEVLQWAKEELGINSDTFNKRRWSLLQREYIKRENGDLVLTDKGLWRLKEEGY